MCPFCGKKDLLYGGSGEWQDLSFRPFRGGQPGALFSTAKCAQLVERFRHLSSIDLAEFIKSCSWVTCTNCQRDFGPG